MADTIPRFQYPELFFGFVAPIGVNLDAVLKHFEEELESMGYLVEPVKVTHAYRGFSQSIIPKTPLDHGKTKGRYDSHIDYGNQLREHFKDDSILAAASIARIQRKRLKKRDRPPLPYQGIAYLVYQFKRKEEVDLMRTVYGPLFFQVSVYSRRGTRVEHLAKSFADGQHQSDQSAFRSDAESIVNRDENESRDHGQQVGQIFHDADLIINVDTSNAGVDRQVGNFCKLLFGANNISPTHMEYGMFLAKAAALRTLDLSRQVGAAIFGSSGEVISLGSNEVPRAGGGTYWSEDLHDDRDYVRGEDVNDAQKRRILSEIAEILGVKEAELDKKFDPKLLKDSQLMGALEYGRVVHAEMSALSDAARLGRSTKDAMLYTTTFPCHMCAKHIVAAGIATVVFLEPYPKSRAAQLHGDSISIEKADRGRYNDYPAVEFVHFFGITPRRYRDLFSRSKRKNDVGKFVVYGTTGVPAPIVDVRTPYYQLLEDLVVQRVTTASVAALENVYKDDETPPA